jgi:hypothetical protein
VQFVQVGQISGFDTHRMPSYTSNGDGAHMNMWQRHKQKVAGRGTQVQRPRPLDPRSNASGDLINAASLSGRAKVPLLL